LFANGKYGTGWNGVPVASPVYSMVITALATLAQLLDAAVLVVFGFAMPTFGSKSAT